MNVDDWKARWKEGRIGFHEGRPNALLERNLARLGEGRRVLVPLSGKSEDMAFLAAHGHDVVGVEVAEEGARAFFADHALSPDVVEVGGVPVYRAAHVEIVVANIFACTSQIVGPVDAVYDRAALVALAPDVRVRYASHVRALLAPRSLGLLITFEYPETTMEPPPYSVREDEVRTLFAGTKIEVVGGGSATGPRFKAAGVEAQERCYAIAT